MRTYETSHPWLTFRVNLRKASPRLWMLLGEAASKCEHIAGVPLRPSTAERLHLLFLAKGVLGTTAIEGNTLTEGEVLRHLDGKLELPKSKAYLKQEIDNIVNACKDILDDWRKGTERLDVERVKDFDRRVLEKLPEEEDVVPGEWRTHNVTVGKVYRGAPVADLQYLMERMCEWLNGPEFKPGSEEELIPYAILKAVVAHLYLAWIHPFGNGNGRTARLIEFQILLAAGVPTPAAHLMSNHYNQTRTEYYRQLDRASKSGGDVIPFIEYAVHGFVDGLREQLKVIRDQQWEVTWENYVDDAFRTMTSLSDRRQHRLILALGAQEKEVPFSAINDLNTHLARDYAGKSEKTLQRDLRTLEGMNLIERTAKGVRAEREVILAFLPWRKIPVVDKRMTP